VGWLKNCFDSGGASPVIFLEVYIGFVAM